ncbi:hypothetical protein C8N47_11171 [Mangrovibacterium marinum]|uniref:Uncharacterized protein n=1 Tax=Mangrovibacterium marinum TaxID=1639118 RepID=A0A2T5C0C2_9BACT|nr:hypothetical protein [Mangrovibacterium marinum]PTN08031.1 hypothetical protein C8N47_11171 [Mangrovibacterium marinum]
MKINFNQILKTLEGKALQEPVDETGRIFKDVTLKGVCSSALVNSHEGSGEEKAKAWELACRIIAGADKPVELTVEEAALIKKRIEGYPVIIYGQAAGMLDGKMGK